MASGVSRCRQTSIPSLKRTGICSPYRSSSLGSVSMSTSVNATPSARRAAAISSHRWQYGRPYISTFVSEPRNRNEGDAFAATHLQRDHRALVEAGQQPVELLHRAQLGVLALVH